MSPKRIGIIAVLALALGLLLVTGLALESREVVLLRTTSPGGEVAQTRVWIADADGAMWLEAATPERGWYRDLRARPRAELVRAGVARCVVARGEPGAEGHRRIRRLLRAKYGWADAWVGLLQDTSRSIPVRLEVCRDGPERDS